MTKAGRPIRHYQRTPVEESSDDPARRPRAGHARRRSRCGTMSCLRVDRYDDAAVRAGAGRDRVVQRPRDADADPGEHVDVPDQAAWSTPTAPRCSCRCATCWSRTGREHDDEVRRLNLQYRNRLEFAIGRTCSVGLGGDAGLASRDRGVRRPGCRSARRRRPARRIGRRARCCRWTRCREVDARRAAGRAASRW